MLMHLRIQPGFSMDDDADDDNDDDDEYTNIMYNQ